MKTLVLGDFGANCYIISKTAENTVIIDPGAPDKEFTDALQNIESERITVILTHRHFDHLGGVRAVKEFCDSNNIGFALAIHRLDASALGKRAKESHREDLQSVGIVMTGDFAEQIESIPDPDVLLEDGMSFCGFTILHTPGHSPGSVCLYGEGDDVLYSGDTLFAGSIGRTDLPGGDDESIIQSITTKLLALPDRTVVYPGHGPLTSIGNERKSNPFFGSGSY